MLNLSFPSFAQSMLVEEILLALSSLIAIFLMLLLLSKLFKYKKQNYKSALIIAMIVSIVSFIIRSISLIFSLNDAQKPFVNIIAIVAEVFLLLILIKRAYKKKWPKTILIWAVVYFGKWAIMGLSFLMLLLF